MEAKELEELERVIRMMVSYEAMDQISVDEVLRLMRGSWMKSSHKGILLSRTECFTMGTYHTDNTF